VKLSEQLKRTARDLKARPGPHWLKDQRLGVVIRLREAAEAMRWVEHLEGVEAKEARGRAEKG
jgi:hypothetical protein